MQIDLFTEYQNFSGKKVLIGLSGGIDSMALLCHLASYPDELKPIELHLYYAHFREHSPDTFRFVRAGIEYARVNFTNVIVKITRNSLLKFFERENMIPHPMFAVCSRKLKREPIQEYIDENKIDFDLIGYIRQEHRRIKRQQDKGAVNKLYLISWMNQEDTFKLVEKEIGWFPEIYRHKNGHRRIFKHNNCLPCIHMHDTDLDALQKYYPEYWERAMGLAKKINSNWGRTDEKYAELVCDYCKY